VHYLSEELVHVNIAFQIYPGFLNFH